METYTWTCSGIVGQETQFYGRIAGVAGTVDAVADPDRPGMLVISYTGTLAGRPDCAVYLKNDGVSVDPVNDPLQKSVGMDAVLPTLADIEGSTVLAKESSVQQLITMETEEPIEVEDDIVRNASGYKMSCSIYVYDTSAHATTHDKVTGLVRKDNITISYDANNRINLFKRIPA